METTTNKTQKYIVRANGAGVLYGEIEKMEGNTAYMNNARRLWYWSGAASLSQLAVEGVKRPSECKFTITVPKEIVFNVIEILECTAKAVASIDAVPVWKI